MIYCVEDDYAIRDLMIYTLQASGFQAQGFESDAGFWAAVKKQIPELVILDVMLPGEDGLTISDPRLVSCAYNIAGLFASLLEQVHVFGQSTNVRVPPL